VSHALPRLDSAVRQIRQSAGRKSVSLTTFASFASMWLIPRMEQFQRDNPEIDIRIDASDTSVDLDLADVDLALRYGPVATMPARAVRMFGEQLTPVASPWLLKSGTPVRKPADLAQFEPTCRLLYRGSLTDGLRNTTKSLVGDGGLKTAQLLNPHGFDVDAFIDLPDPIWLSWAERKFIPAEKVAQAKCSLTDISNHLTFFKKDPSTIEEGAKRVTFLANRDAALALRERLIELERAMNEAKGRLARLPGYKRTGGNEIDFSLIIQPTSKTEKQQEQGKPYSSGELLRSILGVREVFMRHAETNRGEDLLTVLAPEIHVEIIHAGVDKFGGPFSRQLL